MKVHQIQHQDYRISEKPNKLSRKNNVSFQKGLPEQITDSLADKKILMFMKEKLGWIKGEIGGVAMTAIGTGLVAPWPIAFNPFVKAKEGASAEEKREVRNTKIYTAMRQPISAVLAAIFQIGALKPIDRYLDQLYNNPETAKRFDVDTNQSLINNKNFVKRNMEKQMKAEGKTKSNMGKVEYEKELQTRIDKFTNNQIDSVAKSIQETHRIQVGEEFIENSKVADIVNKQIDEYIVDAKKLKITEEKMGYYTKRAQVLIENEEYLKEILENRPTDSIKLEAFLKDLLAKEKNPDVKILLEEILDRSIDIQNHRIERTFKRTDNLKHIFEKGFTSEQYKRTFIDRNGVLDDIIRKLENAKVQDVNSATPETIAEAIKNAKDACCFDSKNNFHRQILHDTRTFGHDEEQLVQKIYNDIAKGYKKFVENSYKSHNQIWKILIGVFITLPITCSVLNWVYPRFMNWAFPGLTKAKENKANVEKEVK